MARQREPRGEQEREQERRPQQERPVGQPREEEQGGHERKAERHGDERVAEARARKRRQVAVQEPAERQLQRILGAHEERDDADVERGDDADAGEDEEPPLGPGRQGAAAQHE